MRALDLAITVALLGPALLLRQDLVPWALVLVLLPLHALALAHLRPFAFNERQVPWPLVLLLALLPLELMALRHALVLLGQLQDVPVTALVLTVWTHLGAFLVLHGREGGLPRERRRLGVQAACWLPLPLAVLALLGWVEQALALLGRDVQRLTGGGWARLVLAALLLVLWRSLRPRLEKGGERVGL